MPAKTLMVQGTASHVGKSLVVAALCRLLKNKGYKVTPFKAQNMANNSFATLGGGEIGRAQATQAEACGIEPSVLMNPILLKPTTDRKSQVVVMGKPSETLSAMEYQSYKKKLVPIVKRSLEELMDSYDFVIIEGAGSPAEINLKKHDIVNMAIAKMVSSPVVLVGDIDRGGVFAQLVGTYELLDPDEKKLIGAFLINKFRGDKRILDPGLKWIERRTGKKVLGVLPFIDDPAIAEEDSVTLQESRSYPKVDQKQLLIQVIRLPRISNFTDFEPLGRESDVVLQYMRKPNRHYLPDLLVIPGSKSTISDLKFLWKSGFSDHILKCVKAGIPVIGICGGYQMLGEQILDPKHAESRESVCKGLGLLPVITVFKRKKSAAQVRAIHMESRLEIEGYEIHMGCTQFNRNSSPLFKIIERHGMPVEDFDGLALTNGEAGGRTPFVMGTTIHGIFDNQKFRRYFLNKIRGFSGLSPIHANGGKRIESLSGNYDRLAEMLERNIDMKSFYRIAQLR